MASLEEAEIDSPDEVEGEFSVEKILQRRVRSGRVEYFLKWKGFDDSENTWEPEGNLDCPELIEEFEQQRKLADKRGKAGTPRRASSATKDKEALPLKRKASVLTETPPGSQPTPLATPPATSPALPKPVTTPLPPKPAPSALVPKPESAPAVTPALAPAPAPPPQTPLTLGPPAKVGFERGLPPDVIIGATDSGGSLMFLIMWVGCEEADLVPAKEANSRCPDLVIQFYEERLSWRTTLQDEDV